MVPPALTWIASSFLLGVWVSASAQVLPPRNLSVRWINAFQPEFSWEPPPHPVTNCTYILFYRGKPDYSGENILNINEQKMIADPFVMDGGFLRWSVKTSCDGRESEEAVMEVTQPELVQDLQCYGYTAAIMKCSWSPAADAPDVAFFWTNAPGSSPLQECSSYSEVQDQKRGCDVQISENKEFFILINGTLNSTAVRNSFGWHSYTLVRPPPLNWTVTKSGKNFQIHWIPPSVLSLTQWKFLINLTECGEKKDIRVQAQTSYVLGVKRQCAYCMTIRAESRKGNSLTSQEACFEADAENNWLLYAAITIPVLVAFVATLTFVCCTKNKDKIFLKVPEPRDLITDNNNKSTFSNLYIPAEEERCCQINLLIDKQAGEPHC
ncbi:uncharacterized protein LOC101175200 [Oryzias latipes]|uniref:uncharacterized protein LOC101175200 n=1 Tax=Oryzias latipes TaxID=8090 RepID=UPI0005CC486E|nr:uncharacterized protein LOC101175200 [Oryzias latipes]